MAAKGGKEMLLKVGNGAGTEVFTVIGGIRSKSMTLNAEAIDITNQDSDEWREILDGAGIKSLSLSGSGIFTDDAVIDQIRTDMVANTMRNCQLIEDASGAKWQGKFKFTSFERAGEYNGEQTWSVSLESSGEISFTAGA
jgi:TP901-1 family phage major tail protein